MSGKVSRLECQVADLEAELREARRELSIIKQTAQRLCDTIYENCGKDHGDAMTVGTAWAAAAYIAGDARPGPWSKALEQVPS
jgi:hypothetical protein